MARPREKFRLDELLDVAGVADYLGVEQQTVRSWNWRRKKTESGGIIEPDTELNSGPVWTIPTIRRWAQDTGRAHMLPEHRDSGNPNNPTRRQVPTGRDLLASTETETEVIP